MNEEKRSRISAFRFGVIHNLIGDTELEAGEQERLIRDTCDRKWLIPFSDKTRITRSTILRWVRLYKESGGKLDALCNHERCDQGSPRAIDQETGLALIRLRQELPNATVVRLIHEMHIRKLITPGLYLNRSTVYRFLHSNGLNKKNRGTPEDRRRFEAEFPNDLWQSDCMHGPMIIHENKNRKAYLIAFIDDHSRLVPHAQFYLSESLESYLKSLESAVSTRGLPRKIYTDNGAAFRSHHLEHVTASLGIALLHARPYKPQGKGKIERFFRTVRSEFLPYFKGSTLFEINEAFCYWLNHIYHSRNHSSTGQTPFARFTSNMECLRESPANLKDHFRKNVRRRVAKDRTVSLNGRIFEAPVPVIGKQVTLLYHEQEPERVEVSFEGRSYGLLTVLDIHVNCRVRRDKNNNIELKSTASPESYKGGRLWRKGENQ